VSAEEHHRAGDVVGPAEELLAKYHGPWNGSVDPVYNEYAY
jgi:gamma-glutamylcysteine synthetase